MATPSPTELWRQADSILDQLLDLDQGQRREALERLTAPGLLRVRVEHLLAAVEQPGILDQSHFSGLEAATDDSLPDLSGRTLGAYSLERLIGRGGMSAVYLARRVDGAYDAPVALKVLNAGLLATDWHERFRLEVRFLASLRHPHIASLLDAGVAEDGTPWLVTEFVDGEPIDQYSRRRKLSLRDRVGLMTDLCEAVAFAQKNLIVHRDIKPENVLVTDQGRVVLLDFGIARALDSQAGSRIDRQNTRAFTPQYAAPEQLGGQPVTTATDVFSLGVVLYRLLTDSAPFAGQTDVRRSSVRPSRQVATQDGIDASERKRRIQTLKGDLDNIVLKAMADEPERRYANAEQFRSDLQAWLSYRPVSARAPSMTYRLTLFFQRRTALALTLLTLALVTVVGVSATLWQSREARLQAELARSVSDYLVTVFTSSDPTMGDAEDPPASELLRRGSREALDTLDSEPAVAAELLRVIGSIQRKLSFFDDAEASLSGALERLPQGSRTSQSRAEILMPYAMLAHDTGNYEISVERQESALAALPSSIGPRHPLRLEGHVDLAQLQMWADPPSALNELDRLRSMIDDSTLDDRLRIKAMRTLAMVLGGNELHPDEHAAVLEKALRLAESGAGFGPLEVSDIHGEIGLMHLERSNYALAGESIARVLQVEQGIFGADHPRLVAVLSNLGFAYFFSRQPVESLEAFERAYAIGAAAWDNDHPYLPDYRAAAAGPLRTLAAYERLSELADELATAEMSIYYFTFLQLNILLGLLEQGHWQAVVDAADRLFGDARYKALNANQQGVLRALVALALIKEGQAERARALVNDIAMPEHPPTQWVQQLQALAMIHVMNALEAAGQAEAWEHHLTTGGALTPELESIRLFD